MNIPMVIGDVMSKKITLVKPDTSLRDLWKTIFVHRVNAVPVVDGKRKLVGIISKEDVLKLLYPNYEDMLEDLFTAHDFESMEELFDPATNLDYAARFLRQLLKQHGDTDTAVAHYHSNTSHFQEIYLKNFRAVYEQQRLLARREE